MLLHGTSGYLHGVVVFKTLNNSSCVTTSWYDSSTICLKPRYLSIDERSSKDNFCCQFWYDAENRVCLVSTDFDCQAEDIFDSKCRVAVCTYIGLYRLYFF